MDSVHNLPAMWNRYDDLPVFVLRGVMDGHHPVHTHEYVEIVLVESGTGIYYDGTRENTAHPGDAFIVPRGEYHGIRSGCRLSMINIQFFPDMLHGIIGDLNLSPGFRALFFPGKRAVPVSLHRFPLTPEAFDRAVAIVSGIEWERGQRNENSELVLSGCMAQLVAILARFSDAVVSPSPSDNLAIDAVLHYVEERITEPLTVGCLARVAGMSPGAFARFFTRHVGRSPIDYIVHRRIDLSTGHLTYDDMSVSEVAYAVGFSDPSYFARQFRKLYGMSPREYRQQSLLKKQ